MMLILHPRIGGPPTAAVIANSAWGLMGFGLAIAVLHVAALQFGSAIGLSLALATCIGWNLALWWHGRRKAARTKSQVDGYRPRRDPLNWRQDAKPGRAVEGLYKVEYDINDGSGRSVLYAHAGTDARRQYGIRPFRQLPECGRRNRCQAQDPAPQRVAAPQVAGQFRRSHASAFAAGRRANVYRFAGDVVEDAGSVFRAVMTPLGNDDIPPPGAVGEGGIVSGLYSINIRMLDGIAGGQTGVMLLHDGRILGGDAFFYYLGAYYFGERPLEGRVRQSGTHPGKERASAVRRL